MLKNILQNMNVCTEALNVKMTHAHMEIDVME